MMFVGKATCYDQCDTSPRQVVTLGFTSPYVGKKFFSTNLLWVMKHRSTYKNITYATHTCKRVSKTITGAWQVSRCSGRILQPPSPIDFSRQVFSWLCSPCSAYCCRIIYIYIYMYTIYLYIYIYNTYLYMRIKSSSAYSNQKGHVSPQVSLGLMQCFPDTSPRVQQNQTWQQRKQAKNRTYEKQETLITSLFPRMTRSRSRKSYSKELIGPFALIKFAFCFENQKDSVFLFQGSCSPKPGFGSYHMYK